MEPRIDETEEIGSRPDIMISFLKRKELPKNIEKFGQIYVNEISYGKRRGNHYHKKRHEWILCIMGKIKITLQDIKTKEKDSFILDSEDKPLKRVYIPSFYAHVVENIGEDKAIIVEYSSEQHNPKEDDFHKYEVG